MNRSCWMTLMVVFSMMCSAGSTMAADWPQWRGPNRDGKSAETGLLQEWPEGGPELAWKTEGLGAGFSSVSVKDGRIYTMGDLDDGQYVFALQEDGGEILWKTKVGPTHDDDYGGSRCTPTTDGDRLFVTNTEGDVISLESATGKEVWRVSMVDEYESYLMKAMGSYDWRYAESPLVDGDKVIVTPGHIQAMMVALDKKTGKEIWKTQGGRIGPIGADGAAYSSVVVTEIDGTRQYVQLVGRGVIGVDAETGEMLWGYNRVANDIANIPTSIVTGDYVFSSSGYGTGSALLKITKNPDYDESSDERQPKWLAEEVYFLEGNVMQNHHGGLILHDGYIYTGTGHNKGFPLAVKMDNGEVAWGPIRNEGKDSAAITYADGRIYFRYQNGLMILVEANPEEYIEHGSFPIPDSTKPSWSHPVIANGKLLLKEQGTLFAYDIKAR
jgi:outer membrane protein assembly factor BamB